MRILFITLFTFGIGSSYAKAGYTVEFTFEDLTNSSPIAAFAKIKKFGFDREKIIENSHREGCYILSSERGIGSTYLR